MTNYLKIIKCNKNYKHNKLFKNFKILYKDF